MNDHRLRQGHHERRNLWEYHVDEPPKSKSGECVGQVFAPDLAAEIVAAVNAHRAAESGDLRDRIARVLDDQLGRTWCDNCYPAGTDWQRFTAAAVINALTRHDQDQGRAHEADGPRGRVYAAIRQTLHQLHPDADHDRPTGDHTALANDAARITHAVMDELTGPCGAHFPRLGAGPPLTCELPHGHEGGHRDGHATWTPTEETP